MRLIGVKTRDASFFEHARKLVIKQAKDMGLKPLKVVTYETGDPALPFGVGVKVKEKRSWKAKKSEH